MDDSESKDAELELRGPGESAKGWYSRGYLPHLDSIHALQFITFRLADSLPKNQLEQLECELKQLKSVRNLESVKRKRIDQWLDAGYGCCALGHPEMARVMEQALLKFHRVRYQLIAWCIMPNHVHVLIEPQEPLGKIVQSWKSITARWALRKNAELELRVPGRKLWMPDYWDRFIRDQQHFEQVIDYIHRNPVKAGLCSRPEDWHWSSTRDRGAPAPQQQQEKTP
ncbi:REP-associated tyrosine transposase [Microbulbifer rhizosphaerae]|uniref:Type I restriction enzyme R subunit/putative DNA methylase n=1 Tax=Microbulbifer rhizosphaerae TaxID=1562603 RepID=A0A7W4WA84_9GAMM|nr:transposase [Microbulbifer rhizosphaerae]MBB3059871.1 type I restriction enzyme R subunit/putative DNA methylase [Microbulbifer rhizosphaerae]